MTACSRSLAGLLLAAAGAAPAGVRAPGQPLGLGQRHLGQWRAWAAHTPRRAPLLAVWPCALACTQHCPQHPTHASAPRARARPAPAPQPHSPHAQARTQARPPVGSSAAYGRPGAADPYGRPGSAGGGAYGGARPATAGAAAPYGYEGAGGAGGVVELQELRAGGRLLLADHGSGYVYEVPHGACKRVGACKCGCVCGCVYGRVCRRAWVCGRMRASPCSHTQQQRAHVPCTPAPHAPGTEYPPIVGCLDPSQQQQPYAAQPSGGYGGGYATSGASPGAQASPVVAPLFTPDNNAFAYLDFEAQGGAHRLRQVRRRWPL